MQEPDNKTYWKKVSKLYAPFMKSNSGLYKDICLRIRPYLSKDMNVLELACGTGQLSYPLSRQVRLWEATDFSEAMIAQAKKHNRSSRLHFSVLDATSLPYAPGTFDAVVISNALHIMPCPQQALAEIRRVLKPGGLLFCPTFVHGEYTGSRIRMKLMEKTGFRTYHQWTQSQFLKFLADHGFSVAEYRTLDSGRIPLCFVVAK